MRYSISGTLSLVPGTLYLQVHTWHKPLEAPHPLKANHPPLARLTPSEKTNHLTTTKDDRGKTSDPPAPRGVALTKPCGTRTGAQNQFISNHQPYHPDRITSPSKHRSGMHYYISGTLSLVPGTLYLPSIQLSVQQYLFALPLLAKA